jgi:hypothetical protein
MVICYEPLYTGNQAPTIVVRYKQQLLYSLTVICMAIYYEIVRERQPVFCALSALWAV